MRLLTLILFICLCIGCATPKQANTNSNILNGTWVPVQEEMGGTMFPKAAYENQRLTISDSIYTFIAESIDKGVVKTSVDKMDIYGKEGVNTGKHFTAIFKYDNGLLTICYNLLGESYPQAYETKGKPMYFLSVFKKEPMK